MLSKDATDDSQCRQNKLIGLAVRMGLKVVRKK